MGLMLDALKEIEVRTSSPVILPLPETRQVLCEVPFGTCDAEDDAEWQEELGSLDVESPCLADWPSGDDASPRSSFDIGESLPWPKTDAGNCLFYEKTAEAMLHQLSRAAGVTSRVQNRSAVVALTSPTDGDGKTSVLAGLAPQLAQRLAAGLLVVDCSDRKPDLSESLGLSPDYETRGGAPRVYPTTVSGVHLLPASPCSKGLTWIDDLRQSWPLVLLDTPSLLHPTVGNLASCCDAVYLVVRLGHTPRRAVRRAARAISNAGGKLMGSIVVV